MSASARRARRGHSGSRETYERGDRSRPRPPKGCVLLLRTPRPLEKSYKKGRHRVGGEMTTAKIGGVLGSTLSEPGACLASLRDTHPYQTNVCRLTMGR